MKTPKAIKAFVDKWQTRGDEKSETQTFWIELLTLLGQSNATDAIEFEKRVQLDHTSFIDAYLPTTKVLIEQKSADIDLSKAAKQSDGSALTPFEQAKRYANDLGHDSYPRWIVVSNFRELHIHDMNKTRGKPAVIQLKDLAKEHHRLAFLVDNMQENIRREEELSIQAGVLVGKIYNALLKQYGENITAENHKALNRLCVQLVFCLYAEDTNLFGHLKFHNYLKAQGSPSNARRALIDLFKILNTPEEERDPYGDEELNSFPYVSGGLFSEQTIIPRLTEEIVNLLLDDASAGFDWGGISPTIFGAVFESTLNPETRRKGGMHYTSVENIHKVIDPLFLDDLKDEFNQIVAIRAEKTRTNRLQAFCTKLSQLHFLDPACGSGNFLTETYICLRRLENEALRLMKGGQMSFENISPIQVSINQFYGIEINDFAVAVAQTALWIAEAQMMHETEDIVQKPLDFFPLKTYAHIREGNALRMDWADLVPQDQLHYIMGNPPFSGYAYQTKEQKDDLKIAWEAIPGSLDYVTGWYFKAGQYLSGGNSPIRCAFVSTNSISQGEQVANLWKPLQEVFGLHIHFAHRTFRWNSESFDKAQVHVVIIGFGQENPSEKYLYNGKTRSRVKNINGYLVDAADVFIERRTNPICEVPAIYRGSQPTDDGNFILSEEEKDKLLKQCPEVTNLIRPFMMGKDFIQRKPRYCLWLVDASPAVLRKCPDILKRIEAVREFRAKSTKATTRKKADTPTLFDEIRFSRTDYVAIPKVSSENREYVPVDYLRGNVIAGDKLFVVENSSLYHFGVLNSSIHMAWMRAVTGRLKSDYSYSNTIVYNNLVWADATEEQKQSIATTAEAILEARKLYPDASLADLYDPLAMPPELRKAHQANDKAVLKAYGLPANTSEAEIVAELMKRYQAKIDELEKAEQEKKAQKPLKAKETENVSVEISKSDNLGGNQNGIATNGTRQDQ